MPSFSLRPPSISAFLVVVLSCSRSQHGASTNGLQPRRSEGHASGANFVVTQRKAEAPGTAGDAPHRDVFGVREIYPSSPGGGLWTSEHWASGGKYDITSRIDGHDPRASSGRRGSGKLTATGTGELIMSGAQPRLYVYATQPGLWRDVEVTVYYQRVADDNTAWAGLVIGTRAGREGHATMPCDAHTYYSRLRHDGMTDFAKELMHPSSTPRGSVAASTLWPSTGALPIGTWIGWKFAVYTLADGATVRLESYRDMSQGIDGGTWVLVNDTVDRGEWLAPTDCAEHAPTRRLSPTTCLREGVVFIRNTGIADARYRWITVREIAPAL